MKRRTGSGETRRRAHGVAGSSAAGARAGAPHRGRRSGDGSAPDRARGTEHEGSGYASEARSASLLVGVHPVLEALRARTRAISRILLSRERRDHRAGEIARLAREAGISVQHVPPEALDRIAPRGLPHQGVAAEIAAHAYPDSETLLANAGPRSLFVLLDEVQDPRNLGAIARTAAAVGAQGLFLPLHRSASVTPAADKASAGGLTTLPVARVSNLARLL